MTNHEAHALLDEANADRIAMKVKRALDKYDRVVKLSPGNGAALAGRAACLYQLGRKQESLEAANASLGSESETALAHAVLAFCLEDENRSAESRAHAERAIVLEPHNAEAYECRGVLRAGQGEYESAIQDLQTAIELNPALYLAHANLAGCLQVKRDLHGVYRELKTLVRLRPRPANIVLYWAALLAINRPLLATLLFLPFVNLWLDLRILFACHAVLVLTYLSVGFLSLKRSRRAVFWRNLGLAAAIAFLSAGIVLRWWR